MGWEFEFVCYFVNLFSDGKRSYIMGAKLFTGQSETNVSSGEPDLISRLVFGSSGTPGIGVAFMSPYGSLELDVCRVPNPLTLTEPKIDCWNFRRLSRPREERRLVPEHTLKWC